jgi:lysozyme
MRATGCSEWRRGRSGRSTRRGVRSRVLLAVVCAAGATNACFSRSSIDDRVCAQTASGLRICPGGSVVHGIDVSTYQGTIAWSDVKAAGIAFAFARISDGTTAPDAQFTGNWTGMKIAGVLRGPYQYFRASEDPLTQASLVVSSLNAAGGLLAGDLPVVMDMETSDDQSNAKVQAQMTIWLEAVAAATGRPPMIYTNSATSSVIGSGFANYALWVANWDEGCPTMPNGWATWRFWQYSSAGSVSGVSGGVDLDEFDGVLGDLMAFAGSARADAAGFDGANGDGADRADSVPEAGLDAEEGEASRPARPCTR